MQQFLTRLFSRLMKSWNWVLLIVLTIAIKWVSWYPDWVEKNYTYGLYPFISRFQRLLFGWIPFSAGDLFYGFLILIILFKTFQFFRIIFRKQFTRAYFTAGLQQIIFFFLFVYVFFNLFWGLNYNRRGIAGQLGLDVKKYSMADLDTLTRVLQQRMNGYAELSGRDQRKWVNRKVKLFDAAVQAYDAADSVYPFLHYPPRSVKPSLFSYAGNYLGFQGYYNPFSGEGQVNTTIPAFLEPYVTTHEMAHQLGYARENEANFVGYLACKYYPDPVFRYSMYLDMYNYAITEVLRRDTTKDASVFKAFQANRHPQVVADNKAYRDFYSRYRNPIEPIIMWGYGHFLRANNQPAGKESYNEVVAWLIAYYKKYGIESL